MPKRIPLSEIEFGKIAIIRFGKADEIMQTLPIIRVLKRQYPQTEIHFIAKEQYCEVLRNVEELHKIHAIKKEAWALTKLHDELADEFINAVFDLQNDFRSGFLYSAFPGAPKLMYKKYLIESFLLKFFKITTKKPIPPLWQRFLDVLPRKNYEILDTDFLSQ
ncbi:MAG: hypothetical protein FWF51_02035 [Chitinivibrionia bacterium]|nr:hypothetical protein [Chitinivibrionia bacterium]